MIPFNQTTLEVYRNLLGGMPSRASSLWAGQPDVIYPERLKKKKRKRYPWPWEDGTGLSFKLPLPIEQRIWENYMRYKRRGQLYDYQ